MSVDTKVEQAYQQLWEAVTSVIEGRQPSVILREECSSELFFPLLPGVDSRIAQTAYRRLDSFVGIGVNWTLDDELAVLTRYTIDNIDADDNRSVIAEAAVLIYPTKFPGFFVIKELEDRSDIGIWRKAIISLCNMEPNQENILRLLAQVSKEEIVDAREEVATPDDI